MSWLARSIANSLKLEDDGDKAGDAITKSPAIPNPEGSPTHSPPSESATPTGRGVKEDLSELTKTLTSQFWGVASFLAPPPESPRAQISDSAAPEPSDSKAADEDLIAGIRSDFAEIGGRFKSGISKLSNNKAVSEFTKIASNLLQFGDEDEAEARAAVGVTDEVLAFARNIAMHPETWLDFPLPDDKDSDDFELSDAQQEHALAVERLAPALAALRIELCPGHMSENHFWTIYFVLLHPRLSKNDAQRLSTPQIVEARSMLTQELQNRDKVKMVPESSGIMGTINPRGVADSPKQLLSVPPSAEADFVPIETVKTVSEPSALVVDLETQKHPVQSTEIKIVDKAVVEEGIASPPKYQAPVSGSASKKLDGKFEDDGDDWLKEDSSEMLGVSRTSIPIGDDEDVSFSDLEEDDEAEVPISHKKTTSGSDSSTKDSRDWVRLSGSSAGSDKEINSTEIRHAGSEQVRVPNAETKEANDWLDVDDIDVM